MMKKSRLSIGTVSIFYHNGSSLSFSFNKKGDTNRTTRNIARSNQKIENDDKFNINAKGRIIIGSKITKDD